MSEPAPTTAPTVPDDEWQHLHPLSPVLRGGVVFLAVVGYVLSQVADSVFRALTPGGSSGRSGPDDSGLEQVRAFPLIALGLFLAVVAGSVAAGWLSWKFSKFRIEGNHVELRTGWLFRQHRQVPLERVQAVELSRPLLAQLLGLSAVVVQSAGGKDSQLKLAFLGQQRADEVRARLMELAGHADERTVRVLPGASDTGFAAPSDPAGASQVTGVEGPPAAAPDDVVVAVPNGRLFVATLLHGSTVFLILFVLVLAGVGIGLATANYGPSVGVLLAGALPGLGPILVGIAINRGKELLQHGNFRVSDLGTSVKLRHGLTDQRTTTIPLHRVQALEILQPLWWRPMGWWRVRVNVAGIQGDEHDPTSQTAALPVAPLADALRVVALIDPEVDLTSLSVAAQGDGGEPGWTGVSERARMLDPWSWKRRGYAVSAHSLLVRSGRFTRSATVVPHARIQSLTVDQGPLDRSLELASVTLVSTPGPVSARIQHLAVPDAQQLLAKESVRAARARALMSASTVNRHETPRQAPPTQHTGQDEFSRHDVPGPIERQER